MKWAHESEFTFQGRTYSVKVVGKGTPRVPSYKGDSTVHETDVGVVLRQKCGVCVFTKQDGIWSLTGGREGVFEAAAQHLVSLGV
jgi:hypothetical protein